MRKNNTQQFRILIIALVAMSALVFTSNSVGLFSLGSQTCGINVKLAPINAFEGQWKEIIWSANCDNAETQLRWCEPGVETCDDSNSKVFYTFLDSGEKIDYIHFDKSGIWKYYIKLTSKSGGMNSQVFGTMVDGAAVFTSIVKPDGSTIVPCKERLNVNGRQIYRIGIDASRSGVKYAICQEIESGETEIVIGSKTLDPSAANDCDGTIVTCSAEVFLSGRVEIYQCGVKGVFCAEGEAGLGDIDLTVDLAFCREHPEICTTG